MNTQLRTFAKNQSRPTSLSISTFLACILMLTGLSGCSSKQQETAPEILPAQHWFELKLGTQPVRIQLALSDRERSRGLMHREHLGENEGMLFLFETPRQQSFWMHNTPLPLSIGYFSSDGVLREIYPMYPRDRTPVTSRRNDIQFCLEMNQGWYSAKGVAPGSQLDLSALHTAIKARGYSPESFGL